MYGQNHYNSVVYLEDTALSENATGEKSGSEEAKMVAQNTLEIIRDAEMMVTVKIQMMNTEENEKRKRGRTAMKVEATIVKVTNQVTYICHHTLKNIGKKKLNNQDHIVSKTQVQQN